jgi:NADH-quinone oxidoreductase subunit J
MAVVDLVTLCCFLVGAISAVVVALHPNILYAAVALVFSLLSVAGMYGVLGADFLAAVQLIIYVGGIIVVILFAVMMSENVYRNKFIAPLKSFLFPFFISTVILFALLKMILNNNWNPAETLTRDTTVEAIGRALVGPYALVFQYVAIVLLAGLIGAVVVARPQYGPNSKAGENNS